MTMAKRKTWAWFSRRRWFAAAAIVLTGLLAGGGFYGRSVLIDIAATLPPTPDIATLPVSTSVVDRNGQLLRPFTTDGGRWRLPVTSADVDRSFIEMLVAYEDRHFEDHRGIDWPSRVT